MNIIERLKSIGYEVHKGSATGKSVSTYNVDNIESINYGHMYVITPSGEYKNIVGGIDRPLCFGKEKIMTTRRELMRELYNPTKEQWCIVDNGFSLRTVKIFEKLFAHIGLIEAKSFEIGGNEEPANNETTETFETCFVNASADITKVGDNYIVQIYTQPDIDSFFCHQYIFSHYPSSQQCTAAYYLSQLKSDLYIGIRVKEYQDGKFWAERPEVIEDISEYINMEDIYD